MIGSDTGRAQTNIANTREAMLVEVLEFHLLKRACGAHHGPALPTMVPLPRGEPERSAAEPARAAVATNIRCRLPHWRYLQPPLRGCCCCCCCCC